MTSWGLPTSDTTIDGLTIHWPTTGADGSSTLTDVEKHILKGLNSDWIEQSLKLVKESYGIDFNEDGATVKDITVTFEDDNTNNRLAAVGHSHDSNGKTNALTLIVNMHYYNNIDTRAKTARAPALPYILTARLRMNSPMLLWRLTLITLTHCPNI